MADNVQQSTFGGGSIQTKYDFSNAKFGGGFAVSGGIQMGGNLVDNSITITAQHARNTAQLISTIREIAKPFPEEQREEIALDLDDLEEDINNPEKREPKRIRVRLKRLMAAGAAVLATSGGATAFSNDSNEISGNAAEMSEKAQVFIESVKELAGELEFKIEDPSEI
jgi:hypothetical protein